jgi:hypothetical protein
LLPLLLIADHDFCSLAQPPRSISVSWCWVQEEVEGGDQPDEKVAYRRRLDSGGEVELNNSQLTKKLLKSGSYWNFLRFFGTLLVLKISNRLSTF